MQTHPIVRTVLELNLYKIDGIGGKTVCTFLLEKGEVLVRQNGEGALSQNGDCHIILRFFWRFLVMSLEKKS